MGRFCRVGFVLLGIVFSGCSVHNNPFYNYRMSTAIDQLGTVQPVRPIHHIPGLDIKFTDRRDWTIRQEQKEIFTASRMMARPLYTSAFLAFMLLPPPNGRFENEQEFIREARESRDSDWDGQIHRLDFQTEPGTGKWKSCMKYYKEYTTTDSRHAPGKLLLYEEIGYMCRHPTQDLYYRIDYSERYPADQEVFQFKERGETILNYVEFSPV